MDTGQILADILVGGELKIHLIGVAGSGMSGIAGLLMALGHGVSGSDKARTLAQGFEKQRDQRMEESARREERHHWLTGAATLIEIGIALSTMAIITRRPPFWFGAMGLGAVGTALFALAYLG